MKISFLFASTYCIDNDKLFLFLEEGTGPKPLYSQMCHRPGMQTEVANQHGPLNNATQQHKATYQPPQMQQQQQQQRQRQQHNDFPPTSHMQQQKMLPHNNAGNYDHNLPPHMQQQKMDAGQVQQAIAAQVLDEHQNASGHASPTRANQRGSSFDNEKDGKKNRDLLANAAQGNSAEKQASEPDGRTPSAADMVNTLTMLRYYDITSCDLNASCL